LFEDYNQKIQDYCNSQGTLPFFLKFDINNDQEDEIILVVKTLIGGFGDIIIISKDGTINKVRWKRPMNALHFDYLIERSRGRSYPRFGIWPENTTAQQNEFNVSIPHLITKGYEKRVLYWDIDVYKQEKSGLI
jgi:hypothetical protein